MPTHILNSLSDTQKLAFKIASNLKPGDNLGLVGDLGAGKTTLVQMILKELGVRESITSPTFSIINQYNLADDLMVYHADLYRLDSELDILETGIIDFIADPNSICLIEWADKAETIFKDKLIWVFIDVVGDTRKVNTGNK